jgi:hypothetical protein
MKSNVTDGPECWDRAEVILSSNRSSFASCYCKTTFSSSAQLSSFSFSSQHFLTLSGSSLFHPLISSISSPFHLLFLLLLHRHHCSCHWTTDVVGVTLVRDKFKFSKIGKVLHSMNVHILSDNGTFAVAVKPETKRKLFYIPHADCLE